MKYKRKKILLVLLVLIFTTILVKTIFFKKESGFMEYIPLVLDEYTRIDSTFYKSEKEVNYYLTVKIDADSFEISSVRENLKENIITSIKKNKESPAWLHKNMTFHYIYNDQKGQYLFEEIITPEMY